ncbi:hypothetical protein BGY98DRAFT_915518 [Russula aff. rugulosa BPL654]|nr:hypothetical protein BGY98DRAFT_915518 [Russula aff. rugulosa BPL654]
MSPALWHPSMWGFNVSDGLRPQDPLMNLPFEQWWFHGYLHLPPHPNDIMQLPVGQKAMTELSCDKDATSWWTSGPGGDQQDPNNPDYPCPGQPTTQFHTNGINDLGGCALAVAYKSDANDIQPEDFVVFSVNQTCVWNLHTYFEVPADMPPCPNNKCTCAWFWIHREDSGSEQNYMTAFQCNFANAVSTKTLATPNVPRRCGPEQSNNFTWNYSNCTYGAKQPFYWYQAERNNMFEGTYTPPLYRDLYNFLDGAQNDIFENTTGTGSSPRTLPAMGAHTQPSSSSSSQVTPPGTSGPSSDASPPSQDVKASSHNSQDRPVQPPSYVSSHEGLLTPMRGRPSQPKEAATTISLANAPVACTSKFIHKSTTTAALTPLL